MSSLIWWSRILLLIVLIVVFAFSLHMVSPYRPSQVVFGFPGPARGGVNTSSVLVARDSPEPSHGEVTTHSVPAVRDLPEPTRVDVSTRSVPIIRDLPEPSLAAVRGRPERTFGEAKIVVGDFMGRQETQFDVRKAKARECKHVNRRSPASASKVAAGQQGRRYSAVTAVKLGRYGWGSDGRNQLRNRTQIFETKRCKNLTVFFYPEKTCAAEHFCFPLFKHFRPGDIIPTALHGESWRVTENPQEACIFLVVATSSAKKDQRVHLRELARLPLFSAAGTQGMNHVYISGGDVGADWSFHRPLIQAWPSASNGKKSTWCGVEEKSIKQEREYRKAHRVGFDVPFPNVPFSVLKPESCRSRRQACSSQAMRDRDKNRSRPILASFIGNVVTCAPLRSEVLRRLHCPKSGVIAMEPGARETSGDKAKRRFSDLSATMKSSKFVLAPQGAGRASSFRLLEAMSAGAVPVYIGDVVEPPFSETLPWEEYAMYVKYEEDGLGYVIGDMEEKTNACNGNGKCEWERLQSNSIWVYEHYFASDVRVVAGLLELLGRRIRGQLNPVMPPKGFFETAPGFCIRMAQLERELQNRGHSPPKGGFPVDREC